MRESERKVKKKYEGEGWKCLRKGYPDFLFFRYENGRPKVRFVEVKSDGHELTEEQRKFKELVEEMGHSYEIESVSRGPKGQSRSMTRSTRS